MAKQKHFSTFLRNIEPSSTTVDYISTAQQSLRKYLSCHDVYSDVYMDSFLTGSYVKKTAVRPSKGDNKRDVDIIVVTNYEREDSCYHVLSELCEVLQQSSKYDNVTLQHHSVGIELSNLSIDVVPVVRDLNDSDLYYVADIETGIWEATDPKGHIAWATEVNLKNKQKYKPIVKIFKWWRKKHCPAEMKYPKGITLEKIIADNLGNKNSTIEDLLIETMENIVAAYKVEYSEKDILPIIEDPSKKLESNDLLKGYRASDFKSFINEIDSHLILLNEEGVENDTWRKILGEEFPQQSQKKSLINKLKCEMAVHRQQMPWPFARDGVVFIKLEVKDADGNYVEYETNDIPLKKGCNLYFTAYTGIKKPHHIEWQITNTGKEAEEANCLRGGFERSDNGKYGKKEQTQYKGCHSVQCFVVSNGVCLAKSKDYIINII